MPKAQRRKALTRTGYNRMGSSCPENAAAAHRQTAMTERIQSSRDLVTKARQKVTAARPAATAAGPQCERPYQAQKG